tara:strand:- start:83 stop:1135 length:1053 start_codon:yes stop_codon:yes gene_type:complete
MSFRYTAGLQNVGSYQVSGTPWLKNYSASSGEIKLFEFPNVTNKINIKNLTAGQDLMVAFTEPRRAVDFASGQNFHYATDISSLGLVEVSISLWVNTQTPGNTRIFEFTHINGSSTRMQMHNPTTLRFFVDFIHPTTGGFVAQGGGHPFGNDEWINIIAVIKAGESKLFVNGQPAVPTAAFDITSPVEFLKLGAGSSNFDGIYDNVALFSRALTDSEVSELYNDGAFKSVQTTSVASEIIALWDFEDNHYKQFYAIADTAMLIQDRSSNSFNLIGNGTASHATFVDGQLIENAFDRHKITLSGISEIDLGCKVKQVLIKAAGVLDLNLKASLTGIEASRMHELTGPGIDE